MTDIFKGFCAGVDRHIERKRFIEVTVGDMAAMSPEMRAAWQAEWWRRVTRDDHIRGDYDFLTSRQRYEFGE